MVLVTGATAWVNLWRVGLAERMEEVLAWKDWSAREWSRRAGLQEETHVTQIIRRFRADPEGASVDAGVLAALARAANVSLDWLWFGRGLPTVSGIDLAPDPKYSTRAIAVAAAKLYGFRSEAVARVMAEDRFAEDPGLDYWRARLEAENAAVVPAEPSSRRRKRGPAR
jgi:hypothetical protein